MLYFIFILSTFWYVFGWHIYRDLEESIGNKWGKYIDRRANVHCVA